MLGRRPAAVVVVGFAAGLTAGLAGALGAGACVPLPVIQDARLVRSQDAGVAATVLVPTGSTGKAVGPLVGAMGWTRMRMMSRLEGQFTFQIPTFALGAGLKLGVVGPDRGSPFALALSIDGATSMIDGALGYGGSVISTVRGSRQLDWTLTARYGTAPSLSTHPVLLGLIGLAFPQRDIVIHTAIGFVQNLGGDETTGVVAVIGYDD